MKRVWAMTAVAVGLSAVTQAPLAAQGRTVDEAGVMETVERMFEGMRTNDGDMVRSVVAEGAMLINTEDGQGTPAVSYVPMTSFADMVDNAEQPLDEPIWDSVVHIHDHLATVWTKYAFYFGETFSHCGVNAFLLAHGADGWKITAISHTREQENCELPPGRN